MNTSPTRIWFPEPCYIDITYARRQEHTLDWLARATNLRARECRRFLNESISALPSEYQETLFNALRERWNSAFFELIVARFLQELGASISIETASSTGKRPDFVAEFSDQKIIVEAIAPIINSVAGDIAKNRTPLLDFIEANIPEGWSIGVCDLPNIGPADSSQDFKSIVRQMLAIDPPSANSPDLDLVEKLPIGTIHLRLLPTYKQGGIAWDPPISVIDNTEHRIRHAVKRKRKQVRSSSAPVLLAIGASGISSDFQDFDIALFGRTCGSYNEQRELIHIGFIPSGAFNNKAEGPPTYAGVLAFTEIGFLPCPAPVIYRHPRFPGQFPQSILQLEQRIYDARNGKIQVQPSTIIDLPHKLRFVQRETLLLERAI